ncbi:MAG: hypothetical protein M5U28_55635 [Sandaracinaceae bacterium]|nr:hypothetical protein [Sandaracinaceae bacterium]
MPSGDEVCDGADNDCDPSTPDGADEPTLGDACDGPDDADHCEDGSVVCSGGELSCSDPGDSPTELEVCDGADNDCRPETPDGMADPGLGAPCDDGDADLCADGTQVCMDGALVCTGEDGEDDLDLCNGVDDDCDPATPDGYGEAWHGEACDDDDADLCAGGTYACVSAAMACTGDDGDRPSEAEVCDGVDNDCDPATADGAADPMLGTPCDDPGDLDLCTGAPAPASTGGSSAPATTATSPARSSAATAWTTTATR